MCHQTVGLVARTIEAADIPTLTMSVAYDITEHVRPPRTAFVNYPMGDTVGRPCDALDQRRIVRAAFAALAAGRMSEPGAIADLDIDCDETDAAGRPWQDTVYTREYRRLHMKKRDGSSYAAGE